MIFEMVDASLQQKLLRHLENILSMVLCVVKEVIAAAEFVILKLVHIQLLPSSKNCKYCPII